MSKFAVVEKRFEYKGHDCICVFNRMGFRYGYVSTTLRRDFATIDVECHCGLTFSGALPVDYAPKEAFYIGFDCGHICDGIDVDLAYKLGLIDENTRDYMRSIADINSDSPIRQLDYVKQQCEKIVDQLEVLEK
mgnify:CR=1 FL=1